MIDRRWRTTTAVKDGSDLVKNLLATAAEGHGRGGHVTLGIVATEAVMQGFEHGDLIGAATGGAGAAALYMDVSVKVRRLRLWEGQRDALKAEHAALLRAAGAERFMLDRLCLDDDAPLRCEVERVRAALGRALLLRFNVRF